MSQSTLDRVRTTLIQATGIAPGTPIEADTPLVGGGIALDSSAVLELLVALEKEFGIVLDPEEMLRAGATKTVGALARFIEDKLQKS